MPRRLLALAFLLAITGSLQACESAQAPAPGARQESLPPNRHDPEDPQARSASTGGSAPKAAPQSGDIGREADREEELYRKKEELRRRGLEQP